MPSPRSEYSSACIVRGTEPMKVSRRIAMKYILTLITLGVAIAATPVSARTYDCSKAGNANKAACATKTIAKPKSAAASTSHAVARPAIAVRPTAAATHPAAAARPATIAPRPAATTAIPKRAIATTPRRAASSNGQTVAWTTKSGKTVHYNCAKTGNTNKQACR